MSDLETDEWMWRRPADGVQPMDMGYFLGHQIAQSYYENATDKGQPLIDILSVVDFEGFHGGKRLCGAYGGIKPHPHPTR